MRAKIPLLATMILAGSMGATDAQTGHACRLPAKDCARLYSEMRIIDLLEQRDRLDAPARLNERQIIDYVLDRKYARMEDRMRALSGPLAAEWKRLNHCDIESRSAARRGSALPNC